MLFNYQSSSNKPGIYKITNTHSNRIYIGQAKDFKKRWSGHKSSLLNGRHQNKFLLNDFKKCREELGHDDFLEFHVLEVMEGSTKEQRNQREEFNIASVFDKQDQCYNFKQKTESKERSCHSKTPEETRKKLSENSKKYWSNQENRAKQRELMKEFWCVPENKQKKIEASTRNWRNEETRAKQMKHKNSTENKQRQSEQLKQLWKDETFKIIISENGKRNYLNNIENMKLGPAASVKAKAKTFQGTLVSPTGERYENIHNLRQFCRDHGLGYKNIHSVFAGIQNSHKGWKLDI